MLKEILQKFGLANKPLTTEQVGKVVEEAKKQDMLAEAKKKEKVARTKAKAKKTTKKK